jgi:CBS domain-containing protein
MLTNGFRHLPVVEGRELKGVVSIRDVLEDIPEPRVRHALGWVMR